ncbi:MAG: hypothetical protein LBL66_00060 [Clostridiales bacterium]|nr:hypothetical protein [Clostridiales bacterium]
MRGGHDKRPTWQSLYTKARFVFGRDCRVARSALLAMTGSNALCPLPPQREKPPCGASKSFAMRPLFLWQTRPKRGICRALTLTRLTTLFRGL